MQAQVDEVRVDTQRQGDGARLPARRPVLGVQVSATDYGQVTDAVLHASREGLPLAVAAADVHSVVQGALDAAQRARLNALDIVTPDGQPVRWALNLVHYAGLRERVYGPTLMLHVLGAAAREGLPVYFYGSDAKTLDPLRTRLQQRFPGLRVAGCEPGRYERGTEDEAQALAARIRASGARIVFAGLGCPRQEAFAHDMRALIGMPVLAVGAAFAIHAGRVPQAPQWMQRRGLEWLFRLYREPRRLWRRYLVSIPVYCVMLALQDLGIDWGRSSRTPQHAGVPPQWWL